MTTISVIIPVFNGAPIIGACLDAVLASEVGDYELEVIVVDDRSTDGTADVATGYDVRVVRMDTNSGPAAARNRGAEVSRGDVLIFLDVDIKVKPDTIARLAELVSGPSVGAVFASYDPTTQYEHTFSTFVNLMNCFWFDHLPKEANVLTSAAMALQREVVGDRLFDPAIRRPSVEDIELGWSLKSRGLKVLFAADVKVFHYDEVTPAKFWISRYHMARLWVKAFLRLSRKEGSIFRPFNPVYHPVNVILLMLLLAAVGTEFAGVAPPASTAVVGVLMLGWNLPFLRYALRYISLPLAVLVFPHAFVFPVIHLAGLVVGTIQWLVGDRDPYN